MRFDPFAAEIEATEELWHRLARPFDLAPTVEALLGLAPEVVEQLSGVLMATCTEVETLLEAMPGLLRKLTTVIGSNNQRCTGELRGAVQWGETMAAQASSFGGRDVYVCAAPQRAYDTEQNRVLVAALKSVVHAGEAVKLAGEDGYDDEGIRRARRNARTARRFLDHHNLDEVKSDAHPTPREIKRARRGKSARTYEPALALLARADEPLGLAELAPYCDRRTRAQHAVIVDVLDELERRGLRIPAIRSESGSLFAGPLEFIHPRRRGSLDRLHGILIGNVLIDVPMRLRDRDRERTLAELRERARGRRVMPIVEVDDITRAVDEAILAAQVAS